MKQKEQIEALQCLVKELETRLEAAEQDLDTTTKNYEMVCAVFDQLSTVSFCHICNKSFEEANVDPEQFEARMGEEDEL